MSTLAWIVASGVVMSAISLVGIVLIPLDSGRMRRVVLPLVALAAGSLLGGAFFHLLPEAIDELGNELSVYGWFVGGFVVFFLAEQTLLWQHHHGEAPLQHKPVGYLVLLADGAHNLVGGLAVGSAFVVDHRLGVVTWLVEAAHELPQELGDFAVLVHAGFSRTKAILFNFISALAFLAGGIAAYTLAGEVEVAVLLPFAAGNFTYIAAADLIPELTHEEALGEHALHTAAFALGLVLLLGLAFVG
jgi:zinc and cadmium transporter